MKYISSVLNNNVESKLKAVKLGDCCFDFRKIGPDLWRKLLVAALFLTTACSPSYSEPINHGDPKGNPEPAALLSAVFIDEALTEELRELGITNSGIIEPVKNFANTYGCPSQGIEKNNGIPNVMIYGSNLIPGANAATDIISGKKIGIDLKQIEKNLSKAGIPFNSHNLRLVLEKIIAHEMGHVCFNAGVKPPNFDKYSSQQEALESFLNEIQKAGGQKLTIGERGNEIEFYPNGLELVVVFPDGGARVYLLVLEGFVEYLSKKIYGENEISSDIYIRLAQLFESLEQEGRFDVQDIIKYYSKDGQNLIYYVIADILGISREDLTGADIFLLNAILSDVAQGRISIDYALQLIKNYTH